MHWTGRHSLLHHPAANKPVDGWSEASQGLGRMAVIVLGSYFSRAVRKINRQGREFHSRNGRFHRAIHPCVSFSALGRKACYISG
jgi:hypothetical protein